MEPGEGGGINGHHLKRPSMLKHQGLEKKQRLLGIYTGFNQGQDQGPTCQIEKVKEIKKK